jgi:hypothetical protein
LPGPFSNARKGRYKSPGEEDRPPKTAKSAKKVTLDDLQASMDAFIKNTDRVLGRLGNKW